MNNIELSVCILTYERFECLEQTFATIKKTLQSTDIRFEIIISDDFSQLATLDKIKRLDGAKVILSEKNEGLGRNTNKGLENCKGDFILQLQDDWIFDSDPQIFRSVIDFLKKTPEIGVVNFIKQNIEPSHTGTIGKFKYRVFKNVYLGEKSLPTVYPYTDNPHIKVKNFHSIVGNYKENVPMTIMETEFCKEVSKQDRYLICDLDDDFFMHIGDDLSFNPGHRKAKLKEFLLKNNFFKYPFRLYLFFKGVFK